MLNKNLQDNQGFTLVELAIILVIIGLGFYGVANTYLALDGKIRNSRTQIHMDTIYDALAAYAERNYRVPCPIRPNFSTAPEPWGAESGSGGNGGNIPNNCPVLEGIVPFATLGLDSEVIRDGHGNFITYRISRAYGRDPYDGAQVHRNCRTQEWIKDNVHVAGDANINPGLARFCCRRREAGNNALDIEMQAVFGGPRRNVWAWNVDNGGARYAGVDTFGLNIMENANNRNTQFPAFILVSHGKGGAGSFLSTGTGARQGGFMGNREADNANTASSRYTISPFSDVRNTRKYNDTIVWGTQDMLLARASGRMSCTSPVRQ